MDVRLDMRDVERLARDLNANARQIAVASARGVNKTASKALTAANKKIREQVALPASYVREKLKLNKASAAHPEATIRAAQRGVLLSRFRHSATKKGVRVTVKPGQSKLILSAFIIKLRKGKTTPADGEDKKPNLGIAARAFGADGRRVGRLPMDVFHGPSVSQVFDKTRYMIQPDIEADLPRQIAGELRYLLLGRRT